MRRLPSGTMLETCRLWPCQHRVPCPTDKRPSPDTRPQRAAGGRHIQCKRDFICGRLSPCGRTCHNRMKGDSQNRMHHSMHPVGRRSRMPMARGSACCLRNCTRQGAVSCVRTGCAAAPGVSVNSVWLASLPQRHCLRSLRSQKRTTVRVPFRKSLRRRKITSLSA